MAKISANGQKILTLIPKGTDTEEALETATGLYAEDVARALGALARAGRIRRTWLRGAMRYQIVEERMDNE
jgi:hypothetical protein